jgi:hypothetical protein
MTIKALLLASAITACTASGAVQVYGSGTTVNQRPPQDQVERVGTRTGYFWAKGHWEWNNGHWEWVGGRWEKSRVGFLYRDGRWEKRGDVWVYVQGEFVRDGNVPDSEIQGSSDIDDDPNYPDREPPAPQHEDHDVGPPNHVWIEGRWSWRNNDFVWIGGHWEREKASMVWKPGHWERRGRRYRWIEGRWVQR